MAEVKELKPETKRPAAPSAGQRLAGLAREGRKLETRKYKKFRILAGKHQKDLVPPIYSCCGGMVEPTPTEYAGHTEKCSSKEGEHGKGEHVCKDGSPGRIVRKTKTFEQGWVVGSYTNLAKQDPNKYARVDDNMEEGPPPPEEADDDDLEDLTDKQLRKLARAEEADIGDADDREALLAAIRARREAAAESGED